MATRNRDVTKRLNFFDRQFLRAQDFMDEQDYHLDRRRRHNRALHGTGVAEGLEVVQNTGDPASVDVQPGWAVDADGREIVLAQARTIDVTEASELYLSYPDPELLSDESTDPGVTGFTRVQETAVLTRVPTDASSPPTGSLALAGLAPVTGAVEITDMRELAGLRDAEVTEDKLADGAVSIAKLKSSLVLDTVVPVPAPPETEVIPIEVNVSSPRFYLISVFPVANLTIAGQRAIVTSTIKWQQLIEFQPTSQTVSYRLELESDSQPVDAQVKVYRFEET
ncbi:MAG: hypothetical protein GY719_00795 [bacterium]|nr:hypothetical protein [bacterium]